MQTQALSTLNAFAARGVFPVVRQNLIRSENSGLSSLFLLPPFRIRKSSVLTGQKQTRHRAVRLHNYPKLFRWPSSGNCSRAEIRAPGCTRSPGDLPRKYLPTVRAYAARGIRRATVLPFAEEPTRRALQPVCPGETVVVVRLRISFTANCSSWGFDLSERSVSSSV